MKFLICKAPLEIQEFCHQGWSGSISCSGDMAIWQFCQVKVWQFQLPAYMEPNTSDDQNSEEDDQSLEDDQSIEEDEDDK